MGIEKPISYPGITDGHITDRRCLSIAAGNREAAPLDRGRHGMKFDPPLVELVDNSLSCSSEIRVALHSHPGITPTHWKTITYVENRPKSQALLSKMGLGRLSLIFDSFCDIPAPRGCGCAREIPISMGGLQIRSYSTS